MNNEIEEIERTLRGMPLRQPPASLDTKIVRPWRFRTISLAAVAASVVVAILVTVLLLPTKHKPGQQELARETDLEQAIDGEGISAQLLATAELLAKEPEGYRMGLERLRQIVDDYPNTSAAILARQRLQNYNP